MGLKTCLEALGWKGVIAKLVAGICPIPPNPKARTLALSYHMKPLVVPIVKVLTILLIATLTIQLVAMNVTVYASPQPAYVYQKNTGPIPWADSFNVDVEFDMPQLFLLGSSVVVDIIGSTEVTVLGAGCRNTTFRYTLYCNGQKATNATDSTNARGGAKLRGGSSCPGIVVPANTVRAGRNQLSIHIDVDSVTEGTESTSLLCRLERVEVRTTNQSAFLTLFFLSILVWTVVWRWLPRVSAYGVGRPSYKTWEGENKRA